MNNKIFTSEIAKEARVFNKENAIIISATALSMAEQHAYALIQYIATKAYMKSYSNKCIIPLAAFKDYMGTKIKNSKTSIENLFESLNTKTIRMNILNEVGDKKSATKGVSLIDAYFIPNNQFENIVIDMPEHFTDLLRSDKLDYTPSLLQVSRQAKRKYTPRLFDFFYRYATTPVYMDVPKMSIQNFRDICGVKDSSYKKMTDFKKKVLEETKKDLADDFDLEFSYKFEKIGRKVEYISFEFTKEQKAKVIKYMRKEAKKAISVDSDIFIVKAREHSEKENLIKFNEIIHGGLIDRIESAGKILHYKIVLTNGKAKYAVFDQLKKLVEYVQYLAREKVDSKAIDYRAQQRVPELYELMYVSTFDPSIVIPTKGEITSVA